MWSSWEGDYDPTKRLRRCHLYNGRFSPPGSVRQREIVRRTTDAAPRTIPRSTNVKSAVTGRCGYGTLESRLDLVALRTLESSW